MPSTTIVNFLTVVHKSSNGVTIAFPDVCKTPTPAGPIPIPYPNISQSGDTANGSKTVKVDGNEIMIQGSNFKMSTGDEAGSAGGVVSSTTKGKAEFINYSFDVKADGKSVARQFDPMLCNKGGAPNTPPAVELQPPNVALPAQEAESEEFHVLKLFFCYQHPKINVGTTEPVLLESKHKISGPEQREYAGAANYSGAYYEGIAKGDYSLEFLAFNRDIRPLKPSSNCPCSLCKANG